MNENKNNAGKLSAKRVLTLFCAALLILGAVMLAGCTAVVIILVLLFLGGCVSTAKRYISVSENIPGRSRISGYVGFILFIGAIFSVIGAIGWIVMLFTTGIDLAVYAVSAAGTAVYQFCLSRFIHRSRKALKGI